jgi:hypothetical protein
VPSVTSQRAQPSPPWFDIWESQEDFEAFGPTLMPILTGLGVEVAEPVVGRVHNTIEG